MHALQLLKFAQHADLRKELLATGASKLIYAQATPSKTNDDKGKQADKANIPDFLSFYLRNLYSPSTMQEGRLTHVDDIYWGTDTTLDAEGFMGNKL